MLTEADHKEINAAIDDVEQRTSGDLYCVVAHEASNYREVPIAWAAIAALLLPPVCLALGFHPAPILSLIDGWSAVQSSFAEKETVLALSVYALAQGVIFAAVAGLLSIPPIRRLFTLGFLKRHRVRQMARQHFLSTGLHLQRGQPHVLIFLSLAERQVEILADESIHAAAGNDVWQNASKAVVSGMKSPDPTKGILRAIALVGDALVTHFPAGAGRARHTDNLAEI